jgi:hypothetical protein
MQKLENKKGFFKVKLLPLLCISLNAEGCSVKNGGFRIESEEWGV